MPVQSNPFTILLDPTAVLQTCAKSGALDALPVSVRHCADRAGTGLTAGLAEHDAAVEAIYRQAIAKASKTPSGKAKKPAGEPSAQA